MFTKKSNSVAGFAQANGITIAYERSGSVDGKCVILIAGTGMQLIEWPMELVDGLVDAGYCVVRYDNRDCGLSTKCQNMHPSVPDTDSLPYMLRDMAQDAICLLDALEITKAHFVGVSMGGAIAQLAAIDFPNRVLSLTLLSADSGNKDIPIIAKPEAFAHITPPNVDDPDLYLPYHVETDCVLDSKGYPLNRAEIETRRSNVIRRDFDPPALRRQQAVVFMDRFISAHRHNNLSNIVAPTLVIHGMDDVLVPVEAAQDLAARIPGTKLALIAGMNHNIPVALASKFVNLITENAERRPYPNA